MPAIKTAKDIAAKYSRVTQQRSVDFSDGVKNPRRSWAKSALDAGESYRSAVTAAAAEGRFERGVSAAGDEKWKDKVVKVGVARWPSGVAAAQGDFEKGFSPYADVIAATTLSPRYPKGDPRNFDRVRQIGEALHKKRIGA